MEQLGSAWGTPARLGGAFSDCAEIWYAGALSVREASLVLETENDCQDGRL